MRFLLMGLMVFQGLFVVAGPVLAIVAFPTFKELAFDSDVGPQVEFNTLLIAALFGLMAIICFYGVLQLWRKQSNGAFLSVVIGAYLAYVGFIPLFVLNRTDYLLLDGLRGIAMIILGILVHRQLRTRAENRLMSGALS